MIAAQEKERADRIAEQERERADKKKIGKLS